VSTTVAAGNEGRRHRLSRRDQRVVRRPAQVVCPPDPPVDGVLAQLVDGLELYLAALPPGARRAAITGLWLLDNGARLYPPAHGRRFAVLDDDTAAGCYRWLIARRVLPTRVAAFLRGPFVMHYYAVPAVEGTIGCDPARHVVVTARRRTELYADEIARAERAVYADDANP
jgi:hypothetical protein